ncbi:MAG: metallophosphoesterase family protein [Planctomycetaceae bacterium]
MAKAKRSIRLAAFGDIHYSKALAGTLEPFFLQLAASADVVVVCGDLTVHGRAAEAELFARDITAIVKAPILAVLGNHDYEAGEPEQVRDALSDRGITVLDGESHEWHGIGFAGVKGFCGGFGKCMLESWGEPMIKQFVHEVVEDALRLESALSQLRTTQKVVITHYSPIRATVEGEPPEIFPFLGCSRFEDAINRYEATVAFHGHAHLGSPEGKTLGNIPVYNVAMPVLERSFTDRPPFRIVELAVEDDAGSAH